MRRYSMVAILLLALSVTAVKAQIEGESPIESRPVPPAVVVQGTDVENADLPRVGESTGYIPPIDYNSFFRPFYARVEALFLQRTNDANPQTVIQTSGSAAPVVATGQFGFPMVAGPRILLGKRCDAYSAIEATYFGTQFWRDVNEVHDPDNLDLPGALALGANDFRQADVMTASYRSQLHSAEINYVQMCDQFSLLAGFRYLSWTERFNIRALNDTNLSDYDLNTSNNLFCAQLGARTTWLGRHVQWELIGKAALCGNSASQDQRLTDNNNTIVLRDTHSGGSAFSFLGDVNLNALRPINQNWQARVGYNLLFITGLALAPDQLDFTAGPSSGLRLDRQGGVFLHGINIGIDARW
jgi:Putative beta barrel porin-7 (BBP7)